MKKFTKKNNISFVLALTILVIIVVSQTSLAFAQETNYTMLAPLPGTGLASNPNQTTASTYFPGLFQLGIGIAAGLAVIVIAYNGLRYMMSDVITSKSKAREGIKNALFGLLLALGAYVILSTINPSLVNVGFGLKQVTVQGVGTAASPATASVQQIQCRIKSVQDKIYADYQTATNVAADAFEARQHAAELGAEDPGYAAAISDAQSLDLQATQLRNSAGLNQQVIDFETSNMNQLTSANWDYINGHLGDFATYINKITTDSANITSAQLDTIKTNAACVPSDLGVVYHDLAGTQPATQLCPCPTQ